MPNPVLKNKEKQLIEIETILIEKPNLESIIFETKGKRFGDG